MFPMSGRRSTSIPHERIFEHVGEQIKEILARKLVDETMTVVQTVLQRGSECIVAFAGAPVPHFMEEIKEVGWVRSNVFRGGCSRNC